MQARRKTDTTDRAHFRAERFNQRDGGWYFITREGSEEGPFDTRGLAEQRLDSYIGVMLTGWVPVDSQLGLMPLN